LFIDDCPASPNISRLQAEGRATAATRLVELSFVAGGGELKRWVGVVPLRFRNGGWWLFFICPACRRRAQRLRLFGGRPLCRRCLLRHGLRYRIEGGSADVRADARRARIERLRALLEGGPARLRPRPGRVLDRRGSLELSLRRALISARRGVLR
jgi:hypothetical protein